MVNLKINDIEMPTEMCGGYQATCSLKTFATNLGKTIKLPKTSDFCTGGH